MNFVHDTGKYPEYPNLGTKVARLRRGNDRKAHGAAVLEAINRLNRNALQRELPSHNVSCASETNHTTGKNILKAVVQRQRNSLLAYPNSSRKARSIDDIMIQYEEAMREKREAALKALPSAELIAFKRKGTSTKQNAK